MTKIVLLGDLHGNMPATLAMEKEIECIAPDEVYFLGDAVGKGPESDKTCDWVREHCSLCIGGNWDFGIGGREFKGDHFYWNQLGEERMKWLQELPEEGELVMSGICFRLFHGRPISPLLTGRDSDETLAKYLKTKEKTYGGYIFADSHRAFVRTLNGGYVMNTGSVGNGMGVPRAHALLVEGEKDSMEPASIRFSTISVPYNNEEAARIARECKEMPKQESYIQEVLTGIYSR